jgi:hypothetical protein
MALRLRKEKGDLEEGGVGIATGYSNQELQNRNSELEMLVSSLRALLDFSRHREKKFVMVLQDAGIESHVDMDLNELDKETSFLSSIWDRASWLVGLMILQSLSSYILSYNEATLQRHPSIIYFLTMLVGAGGNAG